MEPNTPSSGEKKLGRSEAQMGNQNARKTPKEGIRSKDNLEGFEEGKEFIVRTVREWAEKQEIYIYQPDLEEFLKTI